MKIALISAAFFPRSSPRSFRTTELVKELSIKGHEVTLIIPDNNYDYSDFLNKYKGVKIVRSSKINWTSIPIHGNKFNKWILNKLHWMLVILLEYPDIQWFVKLPNILKAFKDKEEFDLLISIAVPHSIHWGIARSLRKGTKISKCWIADCGDPFMGVKTSFYKHPFYFKYLEKDFCRRADYITVPAESAKNGYFPEFHHKIKVNPQGFNFNEIILNTYQENEKIRFCYAGALYTKIRDPRPLLDILTMVDKDFEFIVYTSQKYFFNEYYEKLGKRLKVKDYIPRLELIKKMSEMDFLINLENGTEAQIPSKLIDYSLSKRPILSLDSQKIDEQKIMEFLNRDYKNKFVVPNIEQYEISNVVQKFIDLTKPI